MTRNLAPTRLLTKAQAASYLGLPPADFERDCPVAPVALGARDRPKLRYDRVALDKWIDSLGQPAEASPEALLEKFGEFHARVPRQRAQ